MDFLPLWKISKEKAKPVYDFNVEGGQDLLEQRLRYWQHVLNLDHWIIEAKMVDGFKQDVENETITLGMNAMTHESCYAEIAISKKEPSVGRKFDELTLVHELMHCVIPLFGSEDETYMEGVARVYTERQVELIARSLMKAKYNLEMEDFYKQPSVLNDKGCETE